MRGAVWGGLQKGVEGDPGNFGARCGLEPGRNGYDSPLSHPVPFAQAVWLGTFKSALLGGVSKQ